MSTKTKSKKTAKKVTRKPVTLATTRARLLKQARAILAKEEQTIAKFRRDLETDASYGKCRAGSCKLCDATRLIRRADKLSTQIKKLKKAA